MDEDDAIAQMKVGNIDGLKILMEMYQIKAVQAAFMVTRDRAAAEDIVQDAFLRSYERIKQFDSSRTFRPWFYQMVINDALKATNKQRRHVSFRTDEDWNYQKLIDKLDSTTDEPEDLVQRNELSKAVREALGNLSPRQRAVIVQRYYLGMNEREMSDRLDCAPGTIKWYLSTARKRLKVLLKPLTK